MAENSKRGFGAMDDEQQREIARKGGESSGGNQGGNSSSRGFGAMDAEEQRQISSEGGKASHEKGTGLNNWNRARTFLKCLGI
jgi:general stress protein YciG